MIIRIVESDFKDVVKSWRVGSKRDKHLVTKIRVTWYLLFIPIFYYERIKATAL